ncbi:MAG: ABC transporter ATP-binding protein [Deltaproteobacteria bacterium]|nr:ABC transporter ATP-binding protein [Deltaproteobacteria bacterium]
MEANLLIQASHLTKYYGGTCALDKLSLKVAPGETLGLLGPNGAGKTTAIHIFLGLLTPTSGTVSVLGLSPLTHREEISKKINFASADIQLPTNLKVIENLKTFARLYGVKNAAQKIDSLLSLFGMERLRGRLTGALSSGEKTRLSLCKSLLNDPVLLLLDEPTASLDPEIADVVRKNLKQYQKEKGIGMLYTSHNMHEVEQMCDRILFIHQGRIMAEGTRDVLIAKYGCASLDEVFIKIARNHG